ncbi:TonB-dependent receptor [Paracidobacterium acidisoli]|uniref:TonB-dependent transporter Oar-like beta-barrel domain-containing protein n=1 Tax=Paracidobacterium acidisoli TaxID=2303751 RepID=A0A372IQJ9_9BACT|nr:TonB-dependent receptor [Paracidobacterium acidisoli]MBT9331525.1 TonB-dependent receptor [Paracidobacterium acidisoli]
MMKIRRGPSCGLTPGLRLFLLLLLLSGQCLLSVSAQDFRGTATGVISDVQGAVIAGASVSLHSVQDGTDQTATTDHDGRYQFPFLNPGQYDVTVGKPGFAKVRQTGLTISTAQTTELDITLTVASLGQQITVSAAPPLINTQSADRGMTVDQARVENTPLQGQNIFAEAWSAPGVAVTSSVQRLRPFDTSGSSGMSINGGQPGGNEVLVDGTSVLSEESTVAYVPPVSATEEFRVQTSVYDAQYGWTSGGVVNISTKGGTNEFHGSAYEFFQNTVLNANTFGSNYTGTPRQSSHINTFGGAIGAPVIKKKLFGFFAYEELRQSIPDPFVTSVPTPAQRTGDFSQTYYGLSASGAPELETIYDPQTTTLNSSGQYVRTPFPNNKIPADRLNPVAVKVLAGIPLANTAGNATTGLHNFVNNSDSRKFTDYFGSWLARADYVLSPSTRAFVRYSRNKLTESRDWEYSTISTVNPFDVTANSGFNRENHNATIQLTHDFNSKTMLDMHVGFERFITRYNTFQGVGYGLGNLGFSSAFAGEAADIVPAMTWTNYAGAGAQPSRLTVSQGNAFQGMLYHEFGRQTLRTGGEFYLNRVYIDSPGYSAGNFSFTPEFTGSDATATNTYSGNAIASFLLGDVQSGYINVNTNEARQQMLYSLFVQDDIHASSRLTLNAGLRWDVETPMTDRYNAVARGFDSTAASPLQVSGLNLTGGLIYAGVNGTPRGIYDDDWSNFGPRIGAAYRINNRTIVHGGYGLVYSQTFDDPGNAPGFSAQTTMATSEVTGIPYNTLDNPFPSGISKPTGSSRGLATNLGETLTYANPHRHLPWTQQYSLEIQRELPWGMVGSVAYVGSHSTALPVSRSVNEISAADMALGETYLTASVPNPFAGLLPGTSLNSPTTTHAQLLRPHPQFLSITETTNSVGTSTYNALQTLLQKRISSGVSASIAYTYSNTLGRTSYLNPQDAEPALVVSPYAVAHSIQFNGVYDLPFGTHRRFGNDAQPVVRAIISGWRFSAIARLQTGFPLTTPTGVEPTGVSAKLAHPTLHRWFNTCTLLSTGATQNCLAGETPVWKTLPSNTLQTWSPYLSYVRNPPIRNLDASLMRDTAITNRVTFNFRVDFLNLTNTPQWFNGPTTSATSGSFGAIAGAEDQSNLPRVVQFSGKFIF